MDTAQYPISWLPASDDTKEWRAGPTPSTPDPAIPGLAGPPENFYIVAVSFEMCQRISCT